MVKIPDVTEPHRCQSQCNHLPRHQRESFMRGFKPLSPVLLIMLWMACAVCVLVILLTFILPKPVAVKNGRSCGPYLSTPGFTVPHWDIVIGEGESLELFCVLDLEHDLGRNHNATDLRVYRNGSLVESEYLTVVNETTLRFYVEKPPPMKFSVICNLKPREKDGEIFVCLNIVTVQQRAFCRELFFGGVRFMMSLLLLITLAVLVSYYYIIRNCWDNCPDSGHQEDFLPADKVKDSGVQIKIRFATQ